MQGIALSKKRTSKIKKVCNWTCCGESSAPFQFVAKISLWMQIHWALLGCGKAEYPAAMRLLIQTLVCACPRHLRLYSTTDDLPTLPQSFTLHRGLYRRCRCYPSGESPKKKSQLSPRYWWPDIFRLSCRIMNIVMLNWRKHIVTIYHICGTSRAVME